MKKLVVSFLVIILLTPLSYNLNQNISLNNQVYEKNENNLNFENSSYNFKIIEGDFKAYIYTRCNGIEKEIPLLNALFNPIDVDNNVSTGENGKDIKISAFIFPYIQQVNDNWVFAISLVFKIIRLGEEIKDSDFEAYVELSIQDQIFKAGIGSMKGEDLPKEERLVFTVVPYLFYDKEPEYYISLEPVFDEKPSNISIFGEYVGKGHQYIQIDFNPGISSMIKFVPNTKLGKAGISIERFASQETTIKMTYKGKFNADLIIEKLPFSMAFNISFSNKHFEYNSNDEFNVSMIVENMESSIAAKIIYLSRHIVLDGGLDGYINIFINNRKTKLILYDRIQKSSAFFEISNLTGNITLQWKIGLQGYIKINGAKNAKMELNAFNGIFDLKSLQKAEYFSFEWNLSFNGYIAIDTNWERLNKFSMNFSFPNYGIFMGADFIRAEDYKIEWQTIPPLFEKNGNIDFMGNLTLAVKLDGIWYYIL